jgi:hypothetical protein
LDSSSAQSVRVEEPLKQVLALMVSVGVTVDSDAESTAFVTFGAPLETVENLLLP